MHKIQSRPTKIISLILATMKKNEDKSCASFFFLTDILHEGTVFSIKIFFSCSDSSEMLRLSEY